jgi:hypothetical protein
VPARYTGPYIDTLNQYLCRIRYLYTLYRFVDMYWSTQSFVVSNAQYSCLEYNAAKYRKRVFRMHSVQQMN